jgi:hypothetical protein
VFGQVQTPDPGQNLTLAMGIAVPTIGAFGLALLTLALTMISTAGILRRREERLRAV